MIGGAVNHIYNIILSIFVGIMTVIVFNSFYDSPRVIHKYVDVDPKTKINQTN